MNSFIEDILILDDLKLQYKNFSPDIIEDLFYINNKDISKTIDLLIENTNSLHLYENKEQKEESKENFENNLKYDDYKDEDFYLLDENKKEQDKKNFDNNNMIDNLKKIVPFCTDEEIEEKLILCNFDLDRAILSLLDDYKSDNFKKDKDEIKYGKNNVWKFLAKDKRNLKIDLHGKRLAESITFVQQKLEELEEFVRKNKNKVMILLLIITGRGKHSPGNKPVLKPNILKWLKSKNYNVIEEYQGALKVLIQ